MNLKTSFALLTLSVPVLANSGELTGKVFAANGSNGLAGALVYVVAGEKPTAATPQRESPKWTVRGGQFDPRVFVVQSSDSFTITNADVNGYNVHLYFQNGIERNQALEGRGQTLIKTHNPELFARVSDDLGRLHGYLCVLEHRTYALTDAAGTFKLPNLSPGIYTIEAAHPRGGRLSRQITLSDAVTTENFRLPSLVKQTPAP